MHARFYMKAIFEEAIDQDSAEKNPARKLILPKELRPVDKTTLTWDELRLVLASVPLRDRILLTLDMTETFRPSELFALRWSGFEMNNRTLTVSQTAYRGKAARLRQDQEVVADDAPAGRPGGRAVAVEAEVSRGFARCLHFPQFAQAQSGEEERLHPHRQLPLSCAEEADPRDGAREAELPSAARTIATLAQTKGSVKDVQGILGHSKADTTANVYMQQIEEGVKQTLDAIYSELTARPKLVAVS